MSKTVPFDPTGMEITRDLEEVIRGHEARVALFRAGDEDVVASATEQDLMLRTMIRLLSEIIQEGRGLKWAFVRENFFGIGGCIEMEEARTEARARFLIFESSFGLFLSLDRAPLIERAKDTFWADILSLRDIGQLAFNPSAIPNSMPMRQGKVPKRVGHAVGELTRYWRLLKQEGNDLIDFGELEVSWSLDTPVKTLLPALSGTLETFYRISYELYRLERQSRRGG